MSEIPSINNFFLNLEKNPNIDMSKVQKLKNNLPKFIEDCRKLKKELDELNKKDPIPDDSYLFAYASYGTSYRKYQTLSSWFYLQSLVDSGEFNDVITQENVNDIFTQSIWHSQIEYDSWNYMKNDHICKYYTGKSYHRTHRYNRHEHELDNNTKETIAFYKKQKARKNELLRKIYETVEPKSFSPSSFRINPFLVRVFWCNEDRSCVMDDKYEILPLSSGVEFFDFPIKKSQIDKMCIHVEVEYEAWDACHTNHERVYYDEKFVDNCYQDIRKQFEQTATLQNAIKHMYDKEPNNEKIKSLFDMCSNIKTNMDEQIDVISFHL